jgi:amino acid permease
MSHLLLTSSHSGKFSNKFGVWGGYFFSINSVIGSGFLALPYAFNASGWLFGLIFLILMGFESYYFSCELLEILSRIECLVKIEEQNTDRKIPRLTFKEIIFGRRIKEKLLEYESVPNITNRRFDITSIISIVFGKNFSILYMICLYLAVIGAQTSYFSIFSASFAAKIPLGFADTCDIYNDKVYFGKCRAEYWIYWSIFFCSMMYLTIKGLKEQLWFQSCLTIMRFVIISIIIFTSSALIVGSNKISSDEKINVEMPQLINSKNVLNVLPILMFAFMYQLQLPSIAECTRDKKKNLPVIIKMVGITSAIIYGLISMIVPIAIKNVKVQCTIEYSDYSAGYPQDNKPWWTYFISYIVVLFPALDVFSVFPLLSIAFSDNLLGLIYGPNNPKIKEKKILIFYRTLTVAIPGIISFFIFDLAFIMDWVGLIGMMSGPIIFPILHIATREMINVKSRFDSPYYSRVSSI